MMKSPEVVELFKTVLALQNMEDCEIFFEDLCTVKELRDMAQRLKAARMLLDGCTYETIQQRVEISTATISRVNRCIQYGSGGYRTMLERVCGQPEQEQEKV
ncbi:MAG: YerC/YecD family TrpR-related protein [Pygmaiobacter massiliensis]|nr:YerC/YecD family TrpR-related protein [Pygmaiobacter massiliensis]